HDVNHLGRKRRNPIDRIKIAIAAAKARRTLKQDVAREKLIGNGNRPCAGDTEGTPSDFVQEIAPGALTSGSAGEGHSRERGIFYFTHEWRTISSICTKFGSRSKTSKASMVMV